MAHTHEVEIYDNFHFFQEIVGGLMARHAGDYALIQSREIIDYFRTAAEAVEEGAARFGAQPFSVQRVINRPIDLGFLSHAADNGISV